MTWQEVIIFGEVCNVFSDRVGVFFSVMLRLDARLRKLSRRLALLHRASGYDDMLEPERTMLVEGLFVLFGRGTGSTNATVAACTWCV